MTWVASFFFCWILCGCKFLSAGSQCLCSLLSYDLLKTKPKQSSHQKLSGVPTYNCRAFCTCVILCFQPAREQRSSSFKNFRSVSNGMWKESKSHQSGYLSRTSENWIQVVTESRHVGGGATLWFSLMVIS